MQDIWGKSKIQTYKAKLVYNDYQLFCHCSYTHSRYTHTNKKEVAIGNQDLDGERELDINFNAGEMLTGANEMIGHESEISTEKVKSRSRKRS